MMRMTRRGQSIGEYAVLFAIVLGAVFAMQNYVRARLSGAVKTQADQYTKDSESSAFGISRTSDSSSTTALNMTGASSGTVGITSSGSSSVSNP